MPILTLDIDDMRRKTEAFKQACHQCRVSTIHIDPDFFEEMPLNALAWANMTLSVS
jgi:hypothetical protein